MCEMIFFILISKLRVICAMFLNKGMKEFILNYSMGD